MNEDTFQKLNFELEEGRFAQNNGEIVISRHIETNEVPLPKSIQQSKLQRT